MLNKEISYDYFDASNKINRSLFVNFLTEVINGIRSNNRVNVNTEDIVDFLKNARDYSDGKIVSKYSFPPSESFNYTLKSLNLKKLGKKEIDEALEDTIMNLIRFKNGEDYNSKELLLFLEKLAIVLDEEKKESNQLVSSLI